MQEEDGCEDEIWERKIRGLERERKKKKGKKEEKEKEKL